MNITEIKVVLSNDVKVKAYISLVIENCFAIKDIKIIEGKDGVFVAMPCKQGRNGQYRDVAHPINTETRIYFEQTIINAFRSELSKEKPVANLTNQQNKDYE